MKPMALILLFNKPLNVLSQFTDKEGRQTLADFIEAPDIYPAGRLDFDSEGLLLLTNEGTLQARIADPKHKLPKTYWVQVEGEITAEALGRLEKGVTLKDGLTRPAKAKVIVEPKVLPRNPPIRYRKLDRTSWIALTIYEGRNRQVRRMTAEVGFPTLRLIRYSIGPWTIDNLLPGTFSSQVVNLPQQISQSKQPAAQKRNPKRRVKRTD